MAVRGHCLCVCFACLLQCEYQIIGTQSGAITLIMLTLLAAYRTSKQASNHFLDPDVTA